MIDKKSHVPMHGKEYNLENHDKMVRINYARKFASVWHGTKNGVEWHKKHFTETKDAMFKNEIMICGQAEECASVDEATVGNAGANDWKQLQTALSSDSPSVSVIRGSSSTIRSKAFP